MTKTKAPHGDGFTVNPASLSADIRATPVPVADDDLRDRDGNRVVPKHTREEVRARKLGHAAANALIDQRIVSPISAHRADASGLRERRAASEPRRLIAQDAHAMLSQACLNAAAIPASTLTPKQTCLSIASKPGFVLGDTAVMAVVLVRSGAPQWLAILLGFSMAMSTMMVGSQLGRAMALAYQRRSRGSAPDSCPVGERDLYDDGHADADVSRWLVLGGATAGALLVAVTLIGVGEGDPASVALGFGLLAALTFGGSAGAEAYGTNAAAERRHDLSSQRDAATVELTGFEQLAYKAAFEAELADSLMMAVEHGAAAVGATVETIADRTSDTPEVFGYSHPEPPSHVNQKAPRGLPPFDPGGGSKATSLVFPVHRLSDPFGGSTVLGPPKVPSAKRKAER